MSVVNALPAADPGTGLAAMSAQLYRAGWMPGTSGNLSLRAAEPPAAFLITASGRNKGELTAADVVAADADGHALGTGPRPSAEAPIHAAVYRRKRAGAVIHVHSPYATLLSAGSGVTAEMVRVPLDRWELLKGLSLADPARTDLPVFPNWPQVPRIAADVDAYLAGPTADAAPALLLAHHGITVWGQDLQQALNRLECLEAICQLIVLSSPPTRGRHDGSTAIPQEGRRT
jgi:methylthioribose-1-phosphate isomerase